jgi:hypothetical protein
MIPNWTELNPSIQKTRPARILEDLSQSPLRTLKAYPLLDQNSREEEVVTIGVGSEGVLRGHTRSPKVVKESLFYGYKKALMRGQKTTEVWSHLVRTKNLTTDVVQPALAPTQTPDTQ